MRVLFDFFINIARWAWTVEMINLQMLYSIKINAIYA